MQNTANSGARNWFARRWKTDPLFSTGLVLLLMVALQTGALGFNFPSFLAWLDIWTINWLNLLRNNVYVGMIALGMTFVIISGGIDLAVGSTLVAIGTLVMVMIDTGAGGFLGRYGIAGVPAYVIAIAVGMLMGTGLGWFNGLIIDRGKVPPFIATLAAMKILRSVAQFGMKNYGTPKVPKPFLEIASFQIGKYYLLPIFYWLILVVVLHVVSRHTAFGRHVFAVGSNERTTRLSGIDVGKVKRKVYALMGFIVSLAAVIQVARIGSMDVANAGSGYELDAIAAVIVGGTAMSGGRGSIIGTVLGMLIIAVMNNLLILWGVDAFLTQAFKGIIVLCAVLLQRKEA